MPLKENPNYDPTQLLMILFSFQKLKQKKFPLWDFLIQPGPAEARNTGK